jgi:pseudaminic acid cytidylyltransferase
MNSVAIITARGGSKRIPRKNIRSFAGKPILLYPIEAALKSGAFSEVMVSTDDPEIAELAKKAGAKVPFFRSSKNSDDFSSTADVLTEVLEQYRSIGQNFETFCCLYPTAPFVTAERLKEASELLKQDKIETVVTVTRYGHPIQRAFKIEHGLLHMLDTKYRSVRSQDLQPAFHDVGQFYFGKSAPFLQSKKLFTEQTLPIVVPESQVQDIDTEEDWKLAELKYQLMQQG